MDDVDILVDLCSAIASGSAERTEHMMEIAAREVETSQVEEALLQVHLFLGYPRAINAFGRWRRISGMPAAEDARRDDDVWEDRGRATIERVYGGQTEPLLANAAAMHPDLAHWMVKYGYGKVLGRAGLDLKVREQCIVALLAWQDATPQLFSHLRGALNAGVTDERMDAVVQRLAAQLEGTRRETLRRQWHAVRARRTGNE